MRKILLYLAVVSLTLSFAVSAQAARKKAKEAPAPVTAAATSEIYVGKLADFPAGTVKAIPEHKIIVFSDDQGIYAVSCVCPHKQCIVSFKKKEGTIACPCHGAKYSAQGELKSGPAARGLDNFAVSMGEGQALFVHTDEVVPAGTRFVAKKE